MGNAPSSPISRNSKICRGRSPVSKEFAAPLFFLAVFLISWESAVRLFKFKPYIIPGPIVVIDDILKNTYPLIKHSSITGIEAISGFIIANVVAFILASLFAHSKFIEKGLYPYAIALKTTPIIALAPILVLWFGSGILSKIAASALICFFPMLVSTSKGLRTIDTEALDLFESLGATKKQIFFKLRLPNSLPYIFSALKISSSLSVVGAIVGEFVGSDKGLGYLIVYSSYHLEMEKMLSAVVASAIIGILLFNIILYIESIFLKWLDHKTSQEME